MASTSKPDAKDAEIARPRAENQILKAKAEHASRNLQDTVDVLDMFSSLEAKCPKTTLEALGSYMPSLHNNLQDISKGLRPMDDARPGGDINDTDGFRKTKLFKHLWRPGKSIVENLEKMLEVARRTTSGDSQKSMTPSFEETLQKARREGTSLATEDLFPILDQVDNESRDRILEVIAWTSAFKGLPLGSPVVVNRIKVAKITMALYAAKGDVRDFEKKAKYIFPLDPETIPLSREEAAASIACLIVEASMKPIEAFQRKREEQERRARERGGWTCATCASRKRRNLT